MDVLDVLGKGWTWQDILLALISKMGSPLVLKAVLAKIGITALVREHIAPVKKALAEQFPKMDKAERDAVATAAVKRVLDQLV